MQITILRSNDWNGRLPEVLPPGDEPPPPDSNPHPLFGLDLTAEQLYQQQVHNWLVQNAAPPAGFHGNADNADGDGPAQAAWDDWPAPLLLSYLCSLRIWSTIMLGWLLKV